MPIYHGNTMTGSDNPAFQTSKDEWNAAHTGGIEVFTPGGTIIAPSAAITLIVWRAPIAGTVTAVRGYRVGGTGAVVNAKRAGLSLLSSDLSLTSADTWTLGAGLQNTTVATGDKVEIVIVSTTGGPAQVAVQVDVSA